MTIETSIIIPVRNQKESLLLALTSLKKQIKKQRYFEIVICDDGSTDGTSDAIRKLHYPIFFKYFINNPPLGRAANRNLGFEKSVGQNLIFFDGDMVPDDNYIENIIGNGDLTSVKVGQVKPPIQDKLTPLDRYLYSRGQQTSVKDGDPRPARLFTSGNFIISRKHFISLGGFDTSFIGWGGEDTDFGLRLEKAGIGQKNATKAITYHYSKHTLQSLADNYFEFGQKSFAQLISKHPEFLDQIHSSFLGISKVRNATDLFFKIISPLTINSGSIYLAKKSVSILSGLGWPDFVYDYIFWGNLALGYKKRPK